MGGPGIPGSVMAPIPPYFTLFDSLRSVADVLVLDQRGIGLSAPVLSCPPDSALPLDVFTSRRHLVEVLAARATACASHWREEGADPCAYSTVESADDLDDLRRALGARQLDLIAFSYGTRLALATVQRHGDGVGKVVLAGVNVPERYAKEASTIDRKLVSLSHQLASDAAWKGPSDLLAVARTVRQRLQGAPARTSVIDRKTQRSVDLPVGWEGFSALVALHLDDTRLSALLIATATGDDTVLTRFAEAAYNSFGSSPTDLMARAVMCAAGVGGPAVQPASEGASVFDEPIDNEFLREPFCSSLGCDGLRPEFSAPVRSAIPALFVTGSLDFTTPRANADRVRSGFRNGVVLEVENCAHETLVVPAVQQAVVTFLGGRPLPGDKVVAAAPKFLSVAEAKQAAGGRGR